MEKITSRFCDYQNDLKRLIDFWVEYRAASDVRQYPTLWRLRLLLTSRVWDPEKDTRIWENEAGQIIGLVILWRRYQTSAYIVLDSLIRPGFTTQELVQKMLQWGDGRANQIAKEQAGEFTVYLTGAQSGFSTNLLEQSGFSRIPPNPDEHDIYFGKPLQDKIPAPALPAGYKIRKLQKTADLEAYQALCGFAKVNPAHLEELIESEEYSHFVVVNPEGEFVAYCECSFCSAEWQKTKQKIGWIDYVETIPGQQKKGLGQAALLAGLLQLQEWGAETAMLITMNTNLPAVKLYNKAGFEIIEIKEVPGYQKTIPFTKTR